jgi:hypothetical protein
MFVLENLAVVSKCEAGNPGTWFKPLLTGMTLVIFNPLLSFKYVLFVSFFFFARFICTFWLCKYIDRTNAFRFSKSVLNFFLIKWPIL